MSYFGLYIGSRLVLKLPLFLFIISNWSPLSHGSFCLFNSVVWL